MSDRPTRYPHIRGPGVIYPDCSRGIYSPFRISPMEKRELIRRVAQKGVSGIEELLNDLEGEGAIHEKMEEIRRKIAKQVEEIRKKKRSELNAALRSMELKAAVDMGRESDGLMDDEASFRRYSSSEIMGEILASDLIRAIESRDRVEEKRPGFWKRLWKWIRRIVFGVLDLLYSLFRSIFGRRRPETDGPRGGRGKSGRAVALPFPSIERDLGKWEKELDRRIVEDDRLQNAVNRRLSEKWGYSSGILRMKREADPKWYREEAKKVLEEEVVEKARNREGELEAEKKRRMDEARENRGRDVRRREEAMRLQKELRDEERAIKDKVERLTKEEMKRELIRSMTRMGFIVKKGDVDDESGERLEWEITEALVERFSELIFTDIMESNRGLRDRRGHQVSDVGVYEKGRMRTIHEEPRMDILTSIVNSRINHPGDRSLDPMDLIVLREVTTSDMHAVMLVDISGSMEENGRLEAAKRSVLALLYAIKRDNPRNKVDIVAVSTRPNPMTLKEVMEVQPRGFTNLQESLALAKSILEGSRSERRLLFLITDGLPEAYTDEQGNPVAGDLSRSLEAALAEAEGLLKFRDLAFSIFLLEPREEEFVGSARRIAEAGKGKVVVVDPAGLGKELLKDYLSQGNAIEGI